MTESEDLTRAAVPLQRHGRQRAAVQQRCDRLDETSTDSRVAVEEVCEPCEDDAADDALRQRLAERRCSERRSARLAPPVLILEPLTGSIAVAARDAVDGDVGSSRAA